MTTADGGTEDLDRLYAAPRGAGSALAALAQLRLALSEIRLPSPSFAPGTEPTALDACERLLELLDFGIRQIALFVGEGSRRA